MGKNKMLSKILRKHKKTCLSIDTRKFEIMIKSIKYGANLINDVSGFHYESQSLSKLKNHKIAKVLHHTGIPATMPKSQNIKMFY